MISFLKSLYDQNYTGLVQDNSDEDDDEEESDSGAEFVINTKDNDEKIHNANDDVIVLDQILYHFNYCNRNYDYQIKIKKKYD